MYLISSAVVSWNGVKSEQFKICNSVNQGGVLSPLLFSIFINPLIQKLNECKLGSHMGDICCNVFAYADDLVILSPTCNALKKMMTICEQYDLEFSLSFNPVKCVLIIFSDSESYMNNVSVKMCGRKTQILGVKNTWVTLYQLLGV